MRLKIKRLPDRAFTGGYGWTVCAADSGMPLIAWGSHAGALDLARSILENPHRWQWLLESGFCSARTASGEQCRQMARGNGFCRFHQLNEAGTRLRETIQRSLDQLRRIDDELRDD